MSVTDTEVLVVGGGPVGLSAAALLGQAGIDCVVLERKPGTIGHPRATAIHPRTMEIFRRLGVADRVRAASLSLERAHHVGWRTRLVGGHDLGAIDLRSPVDGPFPSAEPPCFCAQHRLEPLLLDLARSHAGTTVHVDAEAVGMEQDDRGVTVSARVAGVPREFRARYVIGTDGFDGVARRWLGNPAYARPGVTHNVSVHVEADLAEATADLTYLMTWIVNARTRGTVTLTNAERTRWTYNIATTDAVVPTDARLVAEVEAALGDVDATITVLDVLPWHYGTGVAERWREGRVLLAGDAAHHVPPHGGFGMNSGIQDVENLAWKLAATLRGRADDALLATYEAERRPVAEHNLTHTTRALEALRSVGWLAPELDVSEIDDPERGARARAAVAAGVPDQEPHFRTLGQQLGIHYRPGEAQPEDIAGYHDNAAPGRRAPHVWLTDGGRTCSTTDLFGPSPLLLTGGEQWARAAEPHGLRCHPIRDPEERRRWSAAYAVGEGGAVLVRPDGYVAARWPGPVDPEALGEELGEALDALHGR